MKLIFICCVRIAAISVAIIGSQNLKNKNRLETEKTAPTSATDNNYWVKRSLPPGATNVIYIGNYWATFDIQDHHFLFHHELHSESLTELSK